MHNLSTQYKNVLCDTVVMEPDPIMPQFCAFFNASRVTDVCPHYCTIPYTCNVWSFYSRIWVRHMSSKLSIALWTDLVNRGHWPASGGKNKYIAKKKKILQTARFKQWPLTAFFCNKLFLFVAGFFQNCWLNISFLCKYKKFKTNQILPKVLVELLRFRYFVYQPKVR